MINKSFFILYPILILFVAFLAYNYYPNEKNIVENKIILNFNDDAFQKYKETFDLNQSFAYIWGLQEAKKKENNEISKQKNFLNIKKSDFSLCVSEDCFRILGVFNKKGRAYISLYNKNFKHGIKSFTDEQNIAYTLYIKSIYKNTAVIIDKNSSKEWSFTLFDVNATKYKPKDINETNL